MPGGPVEPDRCVSIGPVLEMKAQSVWKFDNQQRVATLGSEADRSRRLKQPVEVDRHEGRQYQREPSPTAGSGRISTHADDALTRSVSGISIGEHLDQVDPEPAHIARAGPSAEVRCACPVPARSGPRIRDSPLRRNEPDHGPDICKSICKRHPESRIPPLTRGFAHLRQWTESCGSTPPTPPQNRRSRASGHHSCRGPASNTPAAKTL